MENTRVSKIFLGLAATLTLSACQPSSAVAQNAAVQNESESVRAVVLAGTTLPAASKAALQKFYADRNYQPAFVRGGQLTQQATELRDAIQRVLPAHGLIARDYLLPSVEAIYASPLNAQNWMQAELTLSRVFVDASIHLSIGRIDPKTVSSDIKFVRRAFDRWADLQSAINNEGIANVWARITPQHDGYKRLMRILAHLRMVEAQGGFKAIAAASTTLRVGSTHPVVQQVKSRARTMGYQISSVDTRFDEEFANVVRDIQAANLADVTGQLSPKDTSSWEYFSVTSTRRIQQTELNMEKFRWLPPQLESRHIFVNLATQELNVVDPALANPALKSMRVIVGRPDRKTPSMRDEIKSVVLNPTWTVPPTVFAEDKLSAIREVIRTQGYAGLDYWFAQNHFILVDSDMNPGPHPTQIDWLGLNPRAADFYIRQTPSYDHNALGVAKILLGNPWAIYLHDTNARDLFATSMRSRSSGCIRLHKPIDLVEYVLQTTVWNRQKIEGFVAKPGETRETETWVKVPNQGKIPVYLVSVTARFGDDNVIRFTRDLYKQNLALLEALQRAGFYKR